ncbi:MAG: PilZ domain-containing protein [Nitrospirae bacterium]|nr:PilZ domain-containing protein [Nitrospirota bacterium]
MGKKKESQDGRIYARYGISSLAMVTIPGTGEVIDALVSNVSRGGVGIYTQSPLPVGLAVRIQVSFLQTNGNQEITEIIPGRVIWVKPLHKHFVVGIAFTALDDHLHSNLIESLNEAARHRN